MLQKRGGPLENLTITDFPAAADQYWDAACDRDDFVVLRHVVGGIGLDNISTEFDCLADERNDLLVVAIDHVAAGFFVRVWCNASRRDGRWSVFRFRAMRRTAVSSP